MEFLEKLGIDYRLLIAQILNFAILLFVLRKFAYGPIVNALEKRKTTIAKSLDDARALEARVAEGERERQAMLQRANDEASIIIAQAKQQAEAVQAKIRESAEAEIQSMKLHASTEAKDMKARALDEAQTEIADLVIGATEKVIGEKLTSDKDRELVERTVEKLRV